MKLDACKVMGILNVTPDSFSDGGRYEEMNKAIERATLEHNNYYAGVDCLSLTPEEAVEFFGRRPTPAEAEKLWGYLDQAVEVFGEGVRAFYAPNA